MNGNDTFLDVNDAHLRVTSGNVYASAFNLDQIDIVMSSNTASTVNFNNPTKAFNAASNIEVGTANLFVDTTTTRVGVGTASPATTLDVAGDLNVSGNLTIIGTTTTLDTDHLRVKDPIIELGKDNTASPVVDLGLVMTRPSGSSNVGIIFDESADTLEIGYTQGNASDSTITMDSAPLSVNVNGTISGNGSGLTALNAANITTGTLALSRGGTGTTTSTGTGSVVLSNAPTFTGDSAFLHAGSGTPHNSNDITLRLGGLNSSGNIIQSKCAVIVSPNTSYGGEADYGRNAIHFCTRNTQDNTNADITNAKISILPNGNVGFSHPNPDKRIHVRTFSNSILAGLDHVTTSGSSGNDEYVGLGFGATSGSQSNRIFKGGIFFNRKGGDTGRGDLLFCIENTQDNTTEVSPANTIMKITRNSDVSITGGFSVSGNATFDTDTLHVDATNDRVGIGTTSPFTPLQIFSTNEITSSPAGSSVSQMRYGSTNSTVLFGVSSTAGHISAYDTSNFSTRRNLCFNADGGNVGVGTASPVAKFEVYGNTVLSHGSGYTHNTDDRTLYIGGRNNNGSLQQGKCAIVATPSTSHGGGGMYGRNALHFCVGPDANNDTSASKADSRLCITHTGNVGIGTTTPQDKLHTDIIRIGDWNGGGNGFKFSMDTNAYLRLQYMTGQTVYKDIMALRYDTGNVGIGTADPDYRLEVGVNTSTAGHLNVIATQPHIMWKSATAHWQMWNNGTDTNLRFWCLADRAYLQCAGVNDLLNFTGQHRTFIKDVPFSQVGDLEGLIVSSDQNKYIKMSGGIECGTNAITVNESLPVVSVSNVFQDKRCFRVISTSEDPDTRQDKHGNLVSIFDKEKGDTRVYINSVGEGAIWVTDINGPLESGDYITTSNVAGYGQKQDSEFLANYTVAKITMDCDFEPVTQPIQQIKKEMGDVNYWVKTTYKNVSEEEYSNLTEKSRRIVDDIYQRVIKEDTKTEKEGYELEIRNELVNALDEHGQIQWEDDPSGATEKAYKIRYLDANGVVTDEANHVHKAAFVGCTYHCG